MADQEAYSRIEQRSVIRFLVAEGCEPVEVHRRMSAVCDATCISQKRLLPLLVIHPSATFPCSSICSFGLINHPTIDENLF